MSEIYDFIVKYEVQIIVKAGSRSEAIVVAESELFDKTWNEIESEITFVNEY